MTPASAPAHIGIVFVNYHSEDLLTDRASRFLDAGHPVVVADNSSSYAGPGRVIDMGSNAGFARACNRAVDALDDDVDVVCLHNPDVDIAVSAVADLALTLRAQANPGIAAPAEQTGLLVRRRGYRYPTVAREALMAALPYGWADRSRRKAASAPEQAGDHASPPGLSFRGRGQRYAAGSCMVVDRSAWVLVNGFDERYFMYGEDLDLWHRLGVAGRSRAFRSDIVAQHHFAAGSPVGMSRRHLCRCLSVQLFFETFQPRSWRSVRSVHRRLLWRYQRDLPRLTGRIGELWRAGATPADVMASIFPYLADADFN
jgi:N-acetylglucosaminyl-diphospho-decaprenol L-rhamnosyltransferase